MSSLPVRKRPLGRTGLALSEIGFGCGPTADLMVSGDAQTRRLAVARALELGIDFFDTAPLYGEGRSETHLGLALRELGASATVATKIVLQESDLGDIAGAVTRSVVASLTRLQLDRLALLQLHNRIGEKRAPQAEFGTGALLSLSDVLGAQGIVEVLKDLRSRGLVQFIGCSAYGGDMSAVGKVIESGGFDYLSVHYSLLNPTAWLSIPRDPEMRDYSGIGAQAHAAGMGVLALRVLERGLLSGAALSPTARLTPDRDVLVRRLRALRPVLDTTLPLASVATRFVLANRGISSALIGFSDVQQIEAAAHTLIRHAPEPV